MNSPLIIYERIDISGGEIIDVDPMILMEMQERLRPSEPFDYNKQADKAHELEKLMRERNK